MHDSLKILDEIRLNFSAESLFILNLTLAFIMFGVALELKKEGFKHVVTRPKSTIIGVLAQFVILPVLTLICNILVIFPH